MIKCWLEINSTLDPPESIKTWDITPRPPETFEVRICVFNCKGVEMMDWEGTSDAYCRGFFDSKEDLSLAATDRAWDRFRDQVVVPSVTDVGDPEIVLRSMWEACVESRTNGGPRGCMFVRLAASITDGEKALRA